MTIKNLNEATNVLNTFLNESNTTLLNHEREDRISQINLVKEKNSLQHAFVQLFLDWNHQVANGGVNNYVSNGYHENSDTSVSFETNDNYDLHKKMVSLTEELLELNKTPKLLSFSEIIKDFDIVLDIESTREETCSTCDGFGVEEDSENEEVTCSSCGGSCCEEVDNERLNEPNFETIRLFEKLTNRYFKINDQLMIEIANSFS